MVAGDRVDDAEQIRVQRRLVEHLAAEPLAAGDPPRPLVVPARVAEQQREKRRGVNLPHVHDPHSEPHVSGLFFT